MMTPPSLFLSPEIGFMPTNDFLKDAVVSECPQYGTAEKNNPDPFTFGKQKLSPPQSVEISFNGGLPYPLERRYGTNI